jgi:rhamnogalacturonyl hydrolase YesR
LALNCLIKFTTSATDLLDTLEAQVKKLAELQHKEGMWHTLLDEPASYLETSATAGFAYGVLKAIRLGYLDSQYGPVGKKAAVGVLKQIDPDGTVRSVSYGTAIGTDKGHYMLSDRIWTRIDLFALYGVGTGRRKMTRRVAATPVTIVAPKKIYQFLLRSPG